MATCSFFCNDPATTEIYTTEDTLSLHDALPISRAATRTISGSIRTIRSTSCTPARSEEHTSELQSPSVISYAVFCLKKTKTKIWFVSFAVDVHILTHPYYFFV